MLLTLVCLLVFNAHDARAQYSPERVADSLEGEAHERESITYREGDASRTSSATPGEARLAVFDDVWQTVRERYYDPSMGGLDWSALRAEFRPRAAEAEGQTELYAVLRRMLARLHDPHTRVFAPDDRSDWRTPFFVTVGVRVREVEGEMLVVEVERGSEAERAGVRAGDAVASIDGETPTSILSRRLSEQSGAATQTNGAATSGVEKSEAGTNGTATHEAATSGAAASGAETSAATRMFAVAHLFDGPRGSFAEVVFRSEGSREKSVRLPRLMHTRPPALRVWRMSDGYGVAQFNIFAAEIAGELARTLRKDLRDARGIILDLRDNGGGEAEAMTDIASFFLPRGTDLGRFTDRQGRVQLEPRTRSAMLSAADVISEFRGTLIVLTSTRTASAAEVFAAALKERGRATLVGESTCGCVLGIRRRHTLPDGGALEVSEVDFRTARGTRLEGAGLAPDLRVTPTRQDLRTGHDRALERAVELLKTTRK